MKLGLAIAVASLVVGAASSEARAADPDPWLAKDKSLHFGVTAGISSLSYVGASFFTPSLVWRTTIGVGVGVAVGGAKEVLDMTGFGDPSWKDFTWDVVGSVVGAGLCLGIDAAVRARYPRRSSPAALTLSPGPRGVVLRF